MGFLFFYILQDSFHFAHGIRICPLQQDAIRRKEKQLMSNAQGRLSDSDRFDWQLAVKCKGPIGFQAPLLNGLLLSLLKPTAQASSGIFPEKPPSTKVDPKVNSEANYYARGHSSTIREKRLESQISMRQSQYGSLYNIVIRPTTRSHLPNFRPVTTDKVDQDQELCASFSGIFNCQDFTRCILVAQTANPCGSHDQLQSSTQGGAVLPPVP